MCTIAYVKNPLIVENHQKKKKGYTKWPLPGQNSRKSTAMNDAGAWSIYAGCDTHPEVLEQAANKV